MRTLQKTGSDKNRDKINPDEYDSRSAKAIFEITRLMSLTGNLEDRLPEIIKYFSSVINAERASLFILSGKHMRFMLLSRFAEGIKSDISLDLQMGLVGTAVLNKKVVNVSDAYDDLRFNPQIDKMTGIRTDSVLCVPITGDQGQVIGAVELINKRTGVFTGDDEKYVLEKASAMAGINFGDIYAEKQWTKLSEELPRVVDCTGCTVFRLNREKGTLSSVAAKGIDGQKLTLDINLGIAGIVAITGEGLIIDDAYKDKRFNKSVDKKSGFRTRQILCLPLKNHAEETIAVIQLINKKEGLFDEDDFKLVDRLSSLVAIFIENSILLNEYHEQYQSILEVMAASIDAKDPFTASHSRMVKEYAVGIAKELGFKQKDIDILSVAAWLHDYGKLGTKEEILTKKGNLLPEEYDHIKKHAANTRIILEKMFFAPGYKNVPLIAASHHERLDGKGYSGGLGEHEIPFFSKIITVADVFEALTAKRHYREAMPVEKAFEIIDEGIGSQFDENIVSAMKRYWGKNHIKSDK
jgi:HD-GYP domain-containing protein (c-di-GMP phosphodiesterase class II)